jgi:dihydrodipicolinate synthase/N-acetylneuraminate lyase
VGAEDLATSVELAREALSAGAEGVILPPPLLFRYPTADLHEYYLQFADQAGRDAEIWIDGAPGADELMATGKFAGVCGQGMRLSPEACAIPELLMELECARRTGDGARQAGLERAVAEFAERAAPFPPLVAVKAAVEMRKIAVGAMPLPLAPDRTARLDEFRQWFAQWLPAAKKATRA